jgi:hypothetical protein
MGLNLLESFALRFRKKEGGGQQVNQRETTE